MVEEARAYEPRTLERVVFAVFGDDARRALRRRPRLERRPSLHFPGCSTPSPTSCSTPSATSAAAGSSTRRRSRARCARSGSRCSRPTSTSRSSRTSSPACASARSAQEVLKSLTPGQQVVKIVHEELTELMGAGSSKLAFAGRPPTVILLAGLQGSGKTTAAAKLALLLRKDGKQPALVAADLQRPAAIDQLEQLGQQIQVPVYREDTKDPVVATRKGLQRAQADGRDVVIVDTAGRLHDRRGADGGARRGAQGGEAARTSLLVLDAMTGQEAVNVAQAFQERIDFDGVVLTKLDGDARGGAALSVKAVTGKPIKLVVRRREARPARVVPPRPDGVAHPRHGRRAHADRAGRGRRRPRTSRRRWRRGCAQGQFTFDDFLPAQKMLAQDGPAAGRHEDDPRARQPARRTSTSTRAQLEAGRGDRALDDAARAAHAAPDRRPRRQRIARGSGTTIEQVNQLLQARKQMEKMMKQMGKGKMPALPGMAGTGGMPATGPAQRAAASNEHEEAKKAKRR